MNVFENEIKINIGNFRTEFTALIIFKTLSHTLEELYNGETHKGHSISPRCFFFPYLFNWINVFIFHAGVFMFIYLCN